MTFFCGSLRRPTAAGSPASALTLALLARLQRRLCFKAARCVGSQFPRCGGGATRGGEARLGERACPRRLTSPPLKR
eukprot:4201997-Pyramimonas_sp.AAC.1